MTPTPPKAPPTILVSVLTSEPGHHLVQANAGSLNLFAKRAQRRALELTVILGRVSLATTMSVSAPCLHRTALSQHSRSKRTARKPSINLSQIALRVMRSADYPSLRTVFQGNV